MASVRSLGPGYYGIESDGIVISKDVRNAVKKAFEIAESVPSGKLKIRSANDASSGRTARK